MSRLFGSSGWDPSSVLGPAEESLSGASTEASADLSGDAWPWPLPPIQGMDDDDLGLSYTIFGTRSALQPQPYQILQEGLQDLTLYPPQGPSSPQAHQLTHQQPGSQQPTQACKPAAAKRSAALSPTAPPSKRRLRSQAAKENVSVPAPGRAGTPCFETWTPSEATKSYKAIGLQQPLAVSQPFGLLKGQAAAGRMSLKDINSRLSAKALGAGPALPVQLAAGAPARQAAGSEQPGSATALAGLVQLVGPGQGIHGATAAPVRVLAPAQLSSANISITVLPGPSQRLGSVKLR